MQVQVGDDNQQEVSAAPRFGWALPLLAREAGLEVDINWSYANDSTGMSLQIGAVMPVG